MILYVYDQLLDRIGLVEEITSLQWLEKYQDAGEVKLVCAANAQNTRLLVAGNNLFCSEHDEIARIVQAESRDDTELTVRAVFSAARWQDRVVQGTETITDAAQGMLSLVENNRRGLTGDSAGFEGTEYPVQTQISWGQVLDGVRTLARASDLGFRETFDPVRGRISFSVYEGVNRTAGENYVGYFGDDVDNLSSVQIVAGDADWKNCAIVGGAGEAAERVILIVKTGEYEGDDLRELWVDAKDLSREYQVATPNSQGGYDYTTNTYTEEEYQEILRARGIEKLSECLKTFTASVEVQQDSGGTPLSAALAYGRDYAIGDIMPIKLARRGLQFSARIMEVLTSYEETGRKISLTLSDLSLVMEVCQK